MSHQHEEQTEPSGVSWSVTATVVNQDGEPVSCATPQPTLRWVAQVAIRGRVFLRRERIPTQAGAQRIARQLARELERRWMRALPPALQVVFDAMQERTGGAPQIRRLDDPLWGRMNARMGVLLPAGWMRAMGAEARRQVRRHAQFRAADGAPLATVSDRETWLLPNVDPLETEAPRAPVVAGAREGR